MDEVNKRCTPANDGEDKHLTLDASWNRKQLVKQGAGHLRGPRLSSLFKHFLGGIEKAQKRNFSIISNMNIIIIIITTIIIIR